MIVKTTTTKDNHVTTTIDTENQGRQTLHEAIENADIGTTITQSWRVGHLEVQVCKCVIEDDGVSVSEQVRWIQTMEDKAILIANERK